jgi:hypothetical protein
MARLLTVSGASLLAAAAAMGSLPEPKPAHMPDDADVVAAKRAKSDAKRARRAARNIALAAQLAKGAEK